MHEDHFRKLKFFSESVLGLRAPERFVITGAKIITGAKTSADDEVTIYLTSKSSTLVVKASMADIDVIPRDDTDAA